MLLACSHLVIATEAVPRLVQFFKECFEIDPYFENEAFAEFVLESKFRIAFFKPVGPATRHFESASSRKSVAFGITVDSVDDLFKRITSHLDRWGASVSGPPKDHPWGEKSFLLIDPEGNRWEVTQSPSKSGMLVNR